MLSNVYFFRRLLKKEVTTLVKSSSDFSITLKMNIWHLAAFFLELSTAVVLVFALKAPVWFTLKGSVPIYGDITVTANLWEQCYLLVAPEAHTTPKVKQPPSTQKGDQQKTTSNGGGAKETQERRSCEEFRILSLPGKCIFPNSCIFSRRFSSEKRPTITVFS